MKQEDKDKLLQIISSENPLKGLQFIALKVPKNYDLGREIPAKVLEVAKNSEGEVNLWAKKALLKFIPEKKKVPEKKPKTDIDLDSLLKKLEDNSITLDELEVMLQSKAERIKKPLCDYLIKTKDPFQISFLVKHFATTFPEESLLPILEQFLTHGDERVVSNTIEGLAAIKSEKTVPIIIPFLSNESNRIRSEAVKALNNSVPEEATKVLGEMLKSKGSKDVLSAIETIKFLKNKEFQEQLTNFLNHPLFNETALFAIKDIYVEDYKEILKPAIKKVGSKKFRETIRELIGIKKKKVKKPDVDLDAIDELEPIAATEGEDQGAKTPAKKPVVVPAKLKDKKEEPPDLKAVRKKFFTFADTYFYSKCETADKWPFKHYFYGPFIPDSKLENAKSAYAETSPGERVLLLFDATTFGSAKKGFLLTEKRFYYAAYGHSFGSGFQQGKISLKKITKLEVKTSMLNTKIFLNDEPLIKVQEVPGEEGKVLVNFFNRTEFQKTCSDMKIAK
ncbi:HEAT repeat domain-containing protein [Candidatus Riflebacteria bacterium]